jgi:outer membrane protein insertion porin family
MSCTHSTGIFRFSLRASIPLAALLTLLSLASLTPLFAQNVESPKAPDTSQGQSDHQSDAQSDEQQAIGQPVTEVEVAGQSQEAAAHLESLIAQKAGQPLTQEAVDESIAALKQSGNFTDVRVQVNPEAGGVSLLFIPEPAYYLGIVHFPGALNAFSYPRLLQVVSYTDGDVFRAARLQKEADALQKFFVKNGYFTAAVTFTVETDEPHRLMNPAFHVTLNKRAKVGAVELQGIPPAMTDLQLKRLKSLWARILGVHLKPGVSYTAERIQKATDYLRKGVSKEGHFAANVRVTSTDFVAASNTANLTFTIDLGPKVFVKVEGAHVSDRTLKRLIPIYEESAYDPDLVNEGRRNLSMYLQSKGYFNTKVQSHINEQSDHVDIVYDVDKGDRFKVEGVWFDGNKHFNDKTLASSIPVQKKHFFSRGHYSDGLLTTSVARITAMYRDAGYSEVKVTYKLEQYEPVVDVNFQIEEGPQTLVHSLQINGDDHKILTANQRKRLDLQPGKPYSAHLLEQDRNRVLAAYLNKGFLNPDFESTATPAADNKYRVDVVYQVIEGIQTSIAEVVTLGAHKTRRSLISHTAALQTQVPLSEGKMFESEGDLYNLGVFDWADVAPRRPVDAEETSDDVLVKLHEAKRNTIDYGFGFDVIHRGGNVPIGAVAIPGLPTIGLGNKFVTSEQAFYGPRGSIEYTRHNIFGLAQTFSVAVLGARLDQRASVSYGIPRTFNTSWSSLFTFSVERSTENPIFASSIGSATLQAEKKLDKKKTKTLIVRYNFQKIDLSHLLIPALVLRQDRKVRLSTVSISFLRDTRDKPLDAHKGWYQTADFGVTPEILGSSASFVRFLGQNAYYKPIFKNLVWANNVRIGFAKPFSNSDVPLASRFFSGGSDTLRGFPINGAGPQRPVPVCANPAVESTCTQISVPVGGNMLVVFNSELRFPLAVKKGLGAAVFYDGGNVYSRINFHEFTSNYSNSIGFGLRYETPVGPIRFDIGRNLSPIPGVNATQYFVTLGQSF